MSREVKRVPLDFDWPLNQVWNGYLMPERLETLMCEQCKGSGTTAARAWLEAITRMILMLDDDLDAQARGRRMHPYFDSTPTHAYGTRPSVDIRELVVGLVGREAGMFGHDSLDGWRALRKIVEAAGLDPETWGFCAACSGEGYLEAYEGQRADAEAWERTEPPAGDGWQMWETVSEGSPISPVFVTPESLAHWLADTKAYPANDYEHWIGMIRAGWAPSAVVTTAGVQSGVEWIGGAR